MNYNYTKCTIIMQGASMVCPFCGTPVNSGDRHVCVNGTVVERKKVAKWRGRRK